MWSLRRNGARITRSGLSESRNTGIRDKASSSASADPIKSKDDPIKLIEKAPEKMAGGS